MPGEDSRQMYQPTIALVRKIVGQITPARCDVAIVYSMNRHAEICHIGSNPTLVFDRYVGQAVNTFMRILTWSEHPVRSTRAFARIFSEQAILAGDAAGAIAGMLMFEQTSHLWNLPHTADDPKVKLQVQLQEMFILAHEYCHLMMAASNEFRQSRLRIADMMLEPIAISLGEQHYAEFIARYPYEVESGLENFLSILSMQDKFIADNSAALRTEFSCDEFALHVTLLTCMQMGNDPKFAFEAAFLTLRNMRALAYIREAAKPGLFERDAVFGLGVKMLQARQHKLRGAYRWVALAYGLEKEFEDIIPDLMDLSDRHDDKIDNPLLFQILGTLVSTRNEIAVENPDLGLESAFEIAEAQGWAPRAPEVEYVLI